MTRPVVRRVVSVYLPNPKSDGPIDLRRSSFDFDAEFRESLARLQALMRTSVPDGDLAKVLDEYSLAL